MNEKLKLIVLVILLMSSCRKEAYEDNGQIEPQAQSITLTKQEAQKFTEALDPDSSTWISNIKINWNLAKSIATANGNKWVVTLEGQPTYQNIKQGFRQLVIVRDNAMQKVDARILEIIPDAIYLQKSRRVDKKTFTGRVFEYDLNYRLKGGRIYSGGKAVGLIRASWEQERLEQANKSLMKYNPFKGAQGKVMLMAIESCMWIQDSYVDAEGTFTLTSEQICSTTYIDDGGGSGYYDNIGSPDEVPTGGGSDTGAPSVPAPANLPGQDNNIVNPREMMECFSKISNANAAFVVRVYVVEPLPGTSFNVGPNSFGHVAISLSKTSGATTITQTIGFYPTGSGLEQLSSKSKIVDNGFDAFNISSTYYVSAESFQSVINYVSNPPKNYHFTDYNCTAFVYGAGQAGGIPIPDPTTQIGLSGPGGAGFAKTPAGMASALRAQKANNPNLDINEAGGSIPPSNGPCNIE